VEVAVPFDASIDYATNAGRVRLLINDTDVDPVFSDAEINVFLSLEGDDVKRAAAQALDTIADDEVLTAKVISDHQLSTNGATVADSLRKRAATLRAQGAPSPRGSFPPALCLPWCT
jgi:hypothetical protein